MHGRSGEWLPEIAIAAMEMVGVFCNFRTDIERKMESADNEADH